MKFDYYLTASDYRAALYFGTVVRMQKALRIAFIMCAISLALAVGGYLRLWPEMKYTLYILLGYFVWFVYLLAVTETTVLRYVKKKDNMLGKQMSVVITEEGMFSLKVEGEQDTIRVPIKNLFLVFENSNMFNIYINEHQTCLLPKRVMGAEDMKTARSLFGRKLKDRFETRFDDNNEPIKRKLWFMPRR